MSNFQIHNATVVQPDLDGDPINLSDIRERLLDNAPPQVFVVLGESQTLLVADEVFATGPCIAVVEGLYNRVGLSIHVLS